MNTKYLRRLRAAFCHDLAPTSTARHNMRQWVAAVRLLGDKWVAIPRRQA